MNPDLLKITNYVNATVDLAESIEADIKAGNKISSKTVLKLSKFVAANKAVATILENIESLDSRLQ